MDGLATVEQQKEKAIELMKQLKFPDEYVREFEKTGTISQIADDGVFCPMLKTEREYMEEFKNRFHATPIAVIRDCLFLPDVMVILFVSQYSGDWPAETQALLDGTPYGYVIEMHSGQSEMGSVSIMFSDGIPMRVG